LFLFEFYDLFVCAFGEFDQQVILYLCDDFFVWWRERVFVWFDV